MSASSLDMAEFIENTSICSCLLHPGEYKYLTAFPASNERQVNVLGIRSNEPDEQMESHRSTKSISFKPVERLEFGID
jgi:hypothetical protein